MKTREESYMPDTDTLLFVHNIDSGVLQPLHDYSSSKGTPSGSDACTLSRITHSPVGVKKEWKRFLKDLRIPSRTLDRNEFLSEFGHRTLTFPAVLIKHGTELSVLINSMELASCRDLGDLIHLVEERLSTG
jgi:hypothetical protein